MLKEKVYKVSIKCWIIFFVICQIILVGLMALSLSILDWVETDFDTSFTYITDDDKDQAYFEASSFEGKFVYCGEGCGVPARDAGYGIVTVSICNYYDDYEDYSTSNSYTAEYSDSIKSICKMFKHLLKAAQFKMLLDVASFVCIVAWFFSMLCMRHKNCCYYFTFISSLCSCSAFFTGSIIWFAFSTATFNDCSEKPTNGELPKICATTGPILMVLKMILFAILVLCYFFVAYKAKKSQKKRNSSNQNVNLPVLHGNNHPLPALHGNNHPLPALHGNNQNYNNQPVLGPPGNNLNYINQPVPGLAGNNQNNSFFPNAAPQPLRPHQFPQPPLLHQPLHPLQSPQLPQRYQAPQIHQPAILQEQKPLQLPPVFVLNEDIQNIQAIIIKEGNSSDESQ